MSTFISLVGIEGEYGIDLTIKSINEKIANINLLRYEFTSQPISNNTVLPQKTKLRYTDFTRLKLIASELDKNPKWTPDNYFTAQSMLPRLQEKYILENKSHLICHLSYTGYFIPVKFNSELLPNKCLMTFGSSINLCNELKEVAGRLRLNLGHYTPDLDLLFDQRIDELEDNDPILSEKILILYLYNFCLASIKNDLAISFK
jgi:hypothetical protein